MNILVTELIWPEGLDELEASGCVAYDPDLWRDPRRLRKEVEIVDALIVRNQTRVDAALLESGASLKAIGRLGVGLDNIDLAAARDREIPANLRSAWSAHRRSMTVTRYDPVELTRFCGEVFVSLTMPREDAEVVADSLVRANLEGADSHGMSRLPIYAQRIREGRISAQPQIGVDRSGSVLRVDGGNALGQVASYHAIEAAFPVARETGIVGVAVRNSNHFGTAAYYCQMACREGMALIATTNSPPGIAPWGGKKAYFGTNPIAFGFPTRWEPPVIVDMSSSVVARGRIMLAATEGQTIPEGWAIDEEGVETTDAVAALKGAVLPLGGAKGYALAMAVEIMSGVLSGAAFGPHVNNLFKDDVPPANVGHSFIVLDIARWIPLEDYYTRMDQFLEEVKAVPRVREVEEVFYPGERRYLSYLEKTKEGVALPVAVQEELDRLAVECDIAFPSPAGTI